MKITSAEDIGVGLGTGKGVGAPPSMGGPGGWEQDAARMARLSQRQFSSICRRLTGRSFIQHVNMVRTRKAVELLKNTDMSVTAIAFEVGYEELSTFYRAFKRLN